MIHVLNYLPKEYDVILDGLKIRLTATGNDALMIDSIRKKLKLKEIKHWVCTKNSTNSSDGDVESMATNLAIRDALKIKMKKKMMIREQNIKTENLMGSATIAVKTGI